MTFTALIHGIGSIGPFTSRAFLPAFITALLLRFGPHVPLIADSGILDLAGAGPTWFTHDITLIVLGVLSLLEIAATKNPDARQMLDEVGGYLKTGMALVTFLGILSATDVAVIEDVMEKAALGDYVVALAVAGGVYFMSAVRSRVLGAFSEADEDDETGVQGLISWFEDLWAVFGLILLVAFPVFMLILIAITAGLLLLARKALEHREEKSKTPCNQCQQPIYACAVSCPHCRAAVAAPRDIGFLGQSKAAPAPDPQAHPFRLVENNAAPCAPRASGSGA